MSEKNDKDDIENASSLFSNDPNNPLHIKIDFDKISKVNLPEKSENNIFINQENEGPKQKKEENLNDIIGKIRVNDYIMTDKQDEKNKNYISEKNNNNNNEFSNKYSKENIMSKYSIGYPLFSSNKISNENSKFLYQYIINKYFY